MTATTAPVATTAPAPLRLVRAEYRKILTTNTWWLFAIGLVLTTVAAMAVNMLSAHLYLTTEAPGPGSDQGPGGAANAQATFDLQHNVATQAANVFTSGQFFGGMWVMLLAILLITNEYYHQTATTTFLTTPRRTAVVGAKFVVAMLAAAGFWLVSTVIDLIGGTVFFNLEGFPNHLGDWAVIHAILVNLMVFALWAVFGIGIGVLIRNQLGATLSATLVYVVGGGLTGAIFLLIRYLLIKHDWVLTAQVIVPSHAAAVAVAATKAYPQAAPWWVGVLVLLGYGIVTGVIGTLIMRRRDIS
jgi:ABC-2 type transport system permease protein